MLTETMKTIARDHPVGFVATVNADGTPNLSPKGTMVVHDDATIMFSEIRSPNTLANAKARPGMAINFLDVLSRTGFKAEGTATVLARADSSFADRVPTFAHHWPDLAHLIRHIILLHVESAERVTTPAYDIGASEAELRAAWSNHFAKL